MHNRKGRDGMKKVYICASFGSDPTESLDRAKRYTEFALRSGAAPVMPHFYGLYQEKAYANACAAAGQSLLWLCDELWIIGDEITEEMRRDIQFSKHLNIHTRKVTEKEITKSIGGNAK